MLSIFKVQETFFLQIFFGPSFKEILIAKNLSKAALGKRLHSHNGLALPRFFPKYGIFMPCLREHNAFNLLLQTGGRSKGI